jgi:hypothetical protein
MSERLHFHSVDDLHGLTLAELQALWELVPTDRQRAYKAAYEREVRSAGAAGSDVLEQQVTAELLKRYQETALVPVGMRWARTPTRVQEAARRDDTLETPDDRGKTASGKPAQKWVFAGGVMALLFVGFMLTRLLGGGTSNEVNEAVEATPTLTPEISPTPTPLALEAQDDVIQGGDPAQAVAYPVNLQVITGDGADPRVWVVQRRAIRASEWNFDPNPDTATFINGMSVRPVIGIPWSEDNAAWFARMQAGTIFTLTMNTGAILRYEFADKTQVRRSNTTIFRQVSPGLVLLLIGETDVEGMPTATRTLVTATYPPEQELSRDGMLLGGNASIAEGSIGQQLRLGEAAVTLLQTHTLTDLPELLPEQQYLVLDFEAAAGSHALDTMAWRIELVDAGGQVYTPHNGALAYAVYGVLPTEIPALSSLPASVGYLVPRELSAAKWRIANTSGSGVSFRITLEHRELELHSDGIDVRLVSVTYAQGQVTTQLRIYNGQADTLHLTQDDIWLAFGYAPEPPGPRNPAEGLTPFDLLPEQAVDLTLVWYWNGEPYASMGIGEYRYAIELSSG